MFNERESCESVSEFQIGMQGLRAWQVHVYDFWSEKCFQNLFWSEKPRGSQAGSPKNILLRGMCTNMCDKRIMSLLSQRIHCQHSGVILVR
jgi:hypothetical protein